MQRVALTDPAAPPLADLVRSARVFDALPQESGACLRRLREGVLEIYAADEMLMVADDVVFVCSGAFATGPGSVVSAGDVIDSGSLVESLRAARASVVLRFGAPTAAAFATECPAIAAAIENALAVSCRRNEGANQ